MLKDTDARLSVAPSSSNILPSLLGDDDLELKKLFVRRHCAATGVKEDQVIASLIAERLLPADARAHWNVLIDVEELIAAGRRESRVVYMQPSGHSPRYVAQPPLPLPALYTRCCVTCALPAVHSAHGTAVILIIVMRSLPLDATARITFVSLRSSAVQAPQLRAQSKWCR